MRKLLLTLALFIAPAVLVQAQTATFTFGEIQGQFSLNQNRCTNITSWNGDPNAYPNAMGSICLNIYPNPWTNIYMPFQLGFPNNGFLTSCLPTVWTPTTPTDNGDGTGTNSFTTSGCYDGQNTVITATVQYSKVIITSCGHGHCSHFTEWQVISGSGTVTNNP